MMQVFTRVFLAARMISHMVVLIILTVILVVLSISWFDLPYYYGISAWAAGWFLWTFTEYVLNRWFLHRSSNTLHSVNSITGYHAKHHAAPENIAYIFIHPLLAGIAISTFLILSLVAAGNAALMLTAGFVCGYACFILLHSLEHHYTAPHNHFLKTLWQNHFLHHHMYPEKAFGVSTSFWDYVLRTLPPRHFFLTVEPDVTQHVNLALSIREVNDKNSEEMFLSVPEFIYRHDPTWIPLVKTEVANTFNRSVNPYFKHGEAKRWIVTKPSGEVLGRVAAFVNFYKMDEKDNRVGGLGFFECGPDQQAAFLLFDAAVHWLVDNFRVTAVDGPVNFGENDKYWGLLINGFTQPSYGMNYNHPYYRKFFEAYGFSIHYKQLTNYVDLRTSLPTRFVRIAERITNNKRYTFKPFRYKDSECFVKDFLIIYNKAWASFNNFQPMTEAVVRKSLAEMKPVMEDEFIWFAYADNKPVGLLLSLPDVNEILKHSGGKFNIWGKLKFIYFKLLKGFTRMRVIVMGIVPEFQNHGLESALILQAYRGARKKKQYKHVELSWVGDFNDKMLAIHKAMGAEEDKQHATFRKIL